MPWCTVQGQRQLSACQVDDTEPCEAPAQSSAPLPIHHAQQAARRHSWHHVHQVFQPLQVARANRSVQYQCIGALSFSAHAGATLAGFVMLVFYFTGAAMLEGPQPYAERSLLCRPVLWWSLAAVALCVLLGRLGHLLLQAFPEEQPSAAAEPAVPAQPAASALAAERTAAETAAPARPTAGQTSTTPVRADPSDAGQRLPLLAHRGAAAAQPSATCGAATETSAPRAGTTRRLIVHQRAGAMCSFDFATEVRTATFSCMTHRLTGGVCDPCPHAFLSAQCPQRSF